MDILTEVKDRFIHSSSRIDTLISNYLMNRLGVDSIETIDALSNNENFTFSKRLDLLLQIKKPSSLKAAKIKIYAEIYTRFLHNPYVDSYQKCYDLIPSYEHFLTTIYPHKKHSNKEKELELLTSSLIKDVENIVTELTKVHTIRIVEDKETKSIFSNRFISNIFRRAVVL